MNNRLLTLLFSVLCLLGLTSLGYGQNPALANINYWDNGTGDPELPLGCPCTEGEPYPDGVQYCLYWDNNANGPDPSDQQPIGDGNPEYGHSNWSCLAMNGDEFNGTPGYFWTSPTLVITIPPTAPDTALYYLRINSGGCCWTSRVFYIGPGLQEFDMLFSEWTCEDDSCSLVGDPPPAPTNVVASDGINCLQVDITWEHTGEDVSSFGIYDEDGFILSTPQSARSARVNVDDDQVHTFEVRASNAYGETPGNPDAGSSYLLHFADGPEGNVYGCELSGDPFTVAFSLPETCPSRVTLHVLGPAGNILYPAFEVDSLTDEISGTLPEGDDLGCRLVLEAYSFDRQVTLTDTTDSTFALGLCLGASDRPVLIPDHFDLAQNYPNPFNPETQIQFSVPYQADVKIEVYNIAGQLVKTLVDGSITAGVHNIAWNGLSNEGISVSSGLYLYRMTGPGFVQAKKMLMLK